MSSIYRLRPIGDLTIEELTEPYLWFSHPSEYKDSEDANIISFVNSNEQIQQSFERIYKNYEEVAKLAAKSGICCFTKSIPPIKAWKKFPKSGNGVLVEYHKEVIENHFINTMGFGNCFSEVEYSDNPTLFNSLNEAILWESNLDRQCYKPMRKIENDPKLMDQLFLKMFTRINSKYKSQNEARIILGGRNIPVVKENVKGYAIKLRKEALVKVFTHPKTPLPFIQQLKLLKIPLEEL